MKPSLILLIAAALILVACSPKPSAPSAASPHEALIRQYYDRFNRHDWAGMAAMYAETAAFKDPSLGPGVVQQTRKQTEEKYAALNALFPDIHDEVVQLYPAGDRHIVVEFVSTGTAPDGTKFELPICTIFTVEKGVITQDFTYYDNSGAGEAQ